MRGIGHQSSMKRSKLKLHGSRDQALYAPNLVKLSWKYQQARHTELLISRRAPTMSISQLHGAHHHPQRWWPSDSYEPIVTLTSYNHSDGPNVPFLGNAFHGMPCPSTVVP